MSRRMNDSRGTWTVLGTPEVEARLDRLTSRAARAISERVGPDRLATLAVIGGYGRGEGGVERVGDESRPHNNVDLMLVTRGLRAKQRARLAHQLEEVLAPISAACGVPIDLGVIGTDTLRRARKQVLWYDVREGHRTIAGDPRLLRARIDFSARDIDPRDVRDLVVNRGTLVLVNLLALARFGGTEHGVPMSWRKRIVRHAMKAIVGYGDALLYADGAYHWSYREKRRRVSGCRLVSKALAHAYDMAIEFRFQPDYQGFLETGRGADLSAWHDELLSMFEPAHRRFLTAIHDSGSQYFGHSFGQDAGIAWQHYPDMCLRHSITRSARSARDWARCVKNAIAVRGRAPASAPASLPDIRTRALYVLASPRDRMAALFPAACYGVGVENPLVRALLDGPLESADRSADESGTANERRRRFLALWAIHGDVNIPDEVRALSRPESVNTAAAQGLKTELTDGDSGRESRECVVNP